MRAATRAAPTSHASDRCTPALSALPRSAVPARAEHRLTCGSAAERPGDRVFVPTRAAVGALAGIEVRRSKVKPVNAVGPAVGATKVDPRIAHEATVASRFRRARACRGDAGHMLASRAALHALLDRRLPGSFPIFASRRNPLRACADWTFRTYSPGLITPCSVRNSTSPSTVSARASSLSGTQAASEASSPARSSLVSWTVASKSRITK